MTAVERIAARTVARVRARLMALPGASEQDGDIVLRGPRSWLRWPAGLLR
jgi:hypothetical protein